MVASYSDKRGCGIVGAALGPVVGPDVVGVVVSVTHINEELE